MGETKQNLPYTDGEISMILDTYMYLNYKGAEDGESLKDIIVGMEQCPQYGKGGLYEGYYNILKDAVKEKQTGNLIIGDQSGRMGYDEGTIACTFTTEDQNTVFVVYRGTADGEWPDNGIGMTSESTLQQKRALDYFEKVVEKKVMKEEQNLIITGHSKGGNKAQFVTMETKYSDLISKCYSVDGQGFSEAAINNWEKRYGKDGYSKRTAKLCGIHGENDYVSVLGISIIPSGQIQYIRTPVEPFQAAGYHDIKYMFANLIRNPITGNSETIFTGRKNSYAAQKGPWGKLGAQLSGHMMELRPDKRDGCAAVIMQIMELGGNKKTGLNGEFLTKQDVEDMLFYGVPAVTAGFLTSDQKEYFINMLTKGNSFQLTVKDSLYLQICHGGICRHIADLMLASEKLKAHLNEITEAMQNLPLYKRDSILGFRKLLTDADRLDRIIIKYSVFSEKLEQALRIYMSKDLELSENLE